MPIFTTLTEIREHSPCSAGWSKLLKSLDKSHADDEPLALEHVLDSNGLDDALWALRAVKGHEKDLRLFACQCARLALPVFEEKYLEDDRPRKAIEAAEAFALGQIDEDELEKATRAADAATRAAYVAADAATRAAYAAALAAYAAADAAYVAADAAADAAAYVAAAYAAYAAYAAADAADAAEAADASTRAEIENLFRGMCSK